MEWSTWICSNAQPTSSATTTGHPSELKPRLSDTRTRWQRQWTRRRERPKSSSHDSGQCLSRCLIYFVGRTTFKSTNFDTLQTTSTSQKIPLFFMTTFTFLRVNIMGSLLFVDRKPRRIGPEAFGLSIDLHIRSGIISDVPYNSKDGAVSTVAYSTLCYVYMFSFLEATY